MIITTTPRPSVRLDEKELNTLQAAYNLLREIQRRTSPETDSRNFTILCMEAEDTAIAMEEVIARIEKCMQE